MLRTKDIESGLWQTPNAMDSLPPRSQEALKKQYDKNRKGRTEHSTLREQVVYPKPQEMWPTPRSSAAMSEKTETVKKRVDKRGFLGAKLEERVAMWPTPNAWDAQRGPRSQENLRTKNHQINLITAVKDAQSENPVKMWPNKMFATPTARDYKDTGKAIVNMKRYTLPQVIARSNKEEWITKGSALNPEWVEWLMGYPIGWTELED
tara:strand:+ start:42 stop:662 length:621 start_codon:yes stop_codon:yes gene_type:complete